MRYAAALLCALALGLAGCPKNPLGSSAGMAGLTNGTAFGYIDQVLTPDVLFAPTSASDNTTRAPKFGGSIVYSWGGASRTEIAASGGSMVYATGPGSATTLGHAPPTNNILLLTGGVGGPSDYYVRWRGIKGPDASLDYSSFTMNFVGNQVNYNLGANGYRGFIFFARGTGNFGVSLAAGNPGDGFSGPYKGYNFFIRMFGSELEPNTWRQITVLFSEMVQLYGAAADINEVLSQAWGLQFEQQPPIQADFRLDVDYVRFF